MSVQNLSVKKKAFSFVISFILLLIAFVLAVCLGAEKLSPKVLLGDGDRFDRIIFLDIRLPRALLALLTGLLLGGSGAIFQLFFRNPLAEPGIMGISSGATLGAVVASTIVTASSAAITRFISPVNLCAFFGAILAGLLVTLLAFSKAGRNSTIMLLLCGTALGTLYSSISSVILLTRNKELHSIYCWILGSFSGRGWKELFFIMIPSVLSIAIMLGITAPLDLLSGGEKSAQSLGVQVDKLRILVLVSGSMAVSAAVCAGGTISFVGLIAPHIVRLIAGPKAKTLVPFSMLSGGILLLLADTIARVVIAPAELPVGIISSILGVPFFLALCLKK